MSVISVFYCRDWISRLILGLDVGASISDIISSLQRFWTSIILFAGLFMFIESDSWFEFEFELPSGMIPFVMAFILWINGKEDN